MRERRKYERFELRLPARIEAFTSNGSQVLNLTTSVISATGGFFRTKESISEGTNVRVRLTIVSERLTELTDTKGLIEVEGKVIRTSSTGIAISFNGECQIASLTTSK